MCVHLTCSFQTQLIINTLYFLAVDVLVNFCPIGWLVGCCWHTFSHDWQTSYPLDQLCRYSIQIIKLYLSIIASTDEEFNNYLFQPFKACNLRGSQVRSNAGFIFNFTISCLHYPPINAHFLKFFQCLFSSTFCILDFLMLSSWDSSSNCGCLSNMFFVHGLIIHACDPSI